MSTTKELSGYDGLKLPFSLEAEQSVLGAILIQQSCLNKVAEILPNAEYFYMANHKTIYEVMLDMFTLGLPIDYVTVLNRFNSIDSSYQNEFKAYLFELAQLVPSISNVEYYANIVKDKYDVRSLITVARDILDDATGENMNSSELLDFAEQKIFDIRKGRNVNGLQRINEIIISTLDRLDNLNSDDADKYRGISTGIGDLDRVIMGLNKSDLILLAARPGMGKTSFALNIASHVAVKLGLKVAFFSLEMTKEQLVSRMLSAHGKILSQNLRTGKLSEEEWLRLIESADILSKTQMYIDDTPGIKISEIKAKLRRLNKIDLVIIDYLQLMSGVKRTDNRVQEISEITRNLKIMSKELDVPVITLSQLSRASEQRVDHRPLLSDLRDSGSIEQDADIVLFLYREGYYPNADPSELEDKNSGECIVAKNRHGETRSIPLHWQGEYMRFTAQEVNIF